MNLGKIPVQAEINLPDNGLQIKQEAEINRVEAFQSKYIQIRCDPNLVVYLEINDASRKIFKEMSQKPIEVELEPFVDYYGNILKDVRGSPYEALMWEIVKFVRSRETAGTQIGSGGIAVRWQNVGKPYALKPFLKRILGITRDTGIPLNFFCSIQRIAHTKKDGTPISADEMQEDFDDLVYGWDFVVDLDGEGDTLEVRVQDAYQKAKKIKALYDKYQLPYAVVFSGSKGFHFWVSWDSLKDVFKASDYGTANKDLTLFVKQASGAQVDTVVAGARKDLIRVPYTINPNSNLVVMPLTDEQFDKLDLNSFKPESVIKMGDLKNRGMLYRPGTINKLMEDFKKWKQ